MKIIILSIRSLLRFRSYTLINIVGLGLSLACVILLTRYINHEVTTDQYIPNLEQLYYTVMDQENNASRYAGYYNYMTDIKTPLEDPAIEKYTSIIPNPDQIITVGEHSYSVNIIATDTNFLQMLPYPILSGNPKQLLQKPDEAIITQALAWKIFGKKNPIGQTIKLSMNIQVMISAVIDEPATASSLQFDMLLSEQLKQDWRFLKWNIVQFYKGVNSEQVNKRHSAFSHNKNQRTNIRFRFFPLKQVYFDTSIVSYHNKFLKKGDWTQIIILSCVTFLLGLIGIFNFVNIYTVLILKRGRELGVKKVFGAHGWQLGLQLYIENVVLIGISLFIAWVCIELSQQPLAQWLEIPAKGQLGFDLALTAGILFLLPFLTSLYPAIKYNQLMPVCSLQSIHVTGHSARSRGIFLCLQNIICISLIIISIFFIKQLSYMLHADLGYRSDNIIQCQLYTQYYNIGADEGISYEKMKERIVNIHQEIETSPLFTSWTFGNSPHHISTTGHPVRIPGQDYQSICISNSSEAYFSLFEIPLVKGRFWNDTIDTFGDYSLIINETAWKLFGFKDINHAYLQPENRFILTADLSMEEISRVPEYKVIGVVKDFIIDHFAKPIPPVLFYYYKEGANSTFNGHIAPGRKQEAIAFLKQLHDQYNTEDFTYTFEKESIQTTYQVDKLVVRIYSIFASIAILISILGLFSLSLFDVQQRYQEIAIRKVNGATTVVIIRMLLRKYYRILAISFLIAAPISWLILEKYLEDFAHRTSISWWIFASALLLTCTITLLTVIYQINKAARMNPVEAIKN